MSQHRMWYECQMNGKMAKNESNHCLLLVLIWNVMVELVWYGMKWNVRWLDECKNCTVPTCVTLGDA